MFRGRRKLIYGDQKPMFPHTKHFRPFNALSERVSHMCLHGSSRVALFRLLSACLWRRDSCGHISCVDVSTFDVFV